MDSYFLEFFCRLELDGDGVGKMEGAVVVGDNSAALPESDSLDLYSVGESLAP